MDRRTFLATTGAAASALCLSGPSHAATAKDPKLMDKRYLSRRNQNRSTVVAQHGMVCASQPLAAQAGIDILKAGGNAIDAAIATNAMLSLVEPMMCGPGGDLFAIVWSEKDQKLFGLNASGRSPLNWNLEEARKQGLKKGIPSQSPFAWSVPGCVSGWEALRTRFGSKGWADLFAPTMGYATEGFPVSPVIARDWYMATAAHETLRETFHVEGGTPKYGELFHNPDLAVFYEMLVRDGADAFYQGEIAERIVRFSEREGGYFSKEDFARHTADWVEPVSTNYRGYDVWEIPPNGQGIATLQVLNLMEHFDVGGLQPNSADHLHLFVEAKKLAYEDRGMYYADMSKADVPLEQLISKEYAAERVKRIDPARAATNVLPGDLDGSTDTVYLTAADSEGNMISLIQSIYAAWGSHRVPDRLGFPLQNRGASFALDESHRNRLEPGKRPFHTIIPAFMTRDGHPTFSFGVMGGAFQPQGQSQVVMNLVDFGLSVQQAGEQPRVEHNGSSDPNGSKMKGGGSVKFERHIPQDTREQLAAMGHEVSKHEGQFGGYQGIWREDDPLRYFGGTDPRKDGCASGY